MSPTITPFVNDGQPGLTPTWRDRAVLVVVLAAGCLLTLLASLSLQQAEELRRKELKTAAMQAVVSAFSLELTRTTEAVRSAGLMMESNPHITRAMFNRYMEKMVGTQLRISLMEWQPIVPANQLERFEATERATGWPDYRVVQPAAGGTGWEPVSGRTEYVPVLYSWPEHYRTEGLDMSFSPERMASKLQSRAIAEPVASGTFPFMKEGMVRSGTTALAISTTVYGADQSARGYLAAVVDLATFFGNATRLADAAHFDLCVFESSAPGAAPVYLCQGEGSDWQKASTGLDRSSIADQRAVLTFAHHAWTVVLHPRPAFFANLPGSGSRWVLAAGLGMTLLILGALYRLQRSRRKIEQAEAHARRARLELELQRQRMLEAQRIAHVGSWQRILADRCTTWSEELYRIHGLDPLSPVPDATEHARLYSPESWQRLNAALQKAAESGIPFELELETVKADGSLGWILARGEAARDASQAVVALQGVSLDITERKQAEAILLKLKEQNHQIQKAESLGVMAGSIAHHFNNKLQAVMANLEALSTLPRDADPSKYLAMAKLASEQAAALSRKMLVYLGNSPGERHPLDLRAFCLASLPALQQTLASGVSLESACPEPGPVIKANPEQLQQLLNNLVTNAAEAMGAAGGTIRLSLSTCPSAEIPTSHRFPRRWQPQGQDYACMEVADPGAGVPSGDIDKLFDPFFSTKFTGRGLGLPVVLGLAQANGGAVTVASRPGQGSSFRVYLPIATEPLPG